MFFIFFLLHFFFLNNPKTTQKKKKTMLYYLAPLLALLVAYLLKRKSTNTRRTVRDTHCLQDKLILVTGCDAGLGHAICLHLSKHGAKVIATCLTSRACTEDKQLKQACLAIYQMDVSNPKSVSNCLKQAHNDYISSSSNSTTKKQTLHIINNAGLMHNAPFELVSERDFDLLYHVNTQGAMCVVKQAQSIFENWQVVAVNICSISAYLQSPMTCGYVASKAALAHYADKAPVRMASIFPGALRTAMTRSFEKQLDGLVARRSAADDRIAFGDGEGEGEEGIAKVREMFDLDLLKQDVLTPLSGVVAMMASDVSLVCDTVLEALLDDLDADANYFKCERYFPSWDAWLTCLFAQYAPSIVLDLMFVLKFNTSILKRV